MGEGLGPAHSVLVRHQNILSELLCLGETYSVSVSPSVCVIFQDPWPMVTWLWVDERARPRGHDLHLVD